MRMDYFIDLSQDLKDCYDLNIFFPKQENNSC